MANYKRILIALELNDDSDALLVDKAKQVGGVDSEYYLVHSVEYLTNYGAAYGVTAGTDVETVLLEEALQSVEAIGSTLGIPSDNQIVKLGPAKFVILEEAEQIKADLIVVGSHGQHGMRFLLGSTANAILHGASCDVLAVRVQDS